MAPRRLAALGWPVDLNRASVEELASLDGIGPQARRRASSRARPFASVDEVARVRGIGAAPTGAAALPALSSTSGRMIA